MNLSNTVKQDVLAELKNGNTEALKWVVTYCSYAIWFSLIYGL